MTGRCNRTHRSTTRWTPTGSRWRTDITSGWTNGFVSEAEVQDSAGSRAEHWPSTRSTGLWGVSHPLNSLRGGSRTLKHEKRAAAVPLVALAACQALVDRAKVEPGQKVLVHAGAGGLGSTVIQLAKHLGAYVATTARGSDADRVRGLGADEVEQGKANGKIVVTRGADA